MSIQMGNRVRDLEIHVEQLKEMVTVLYQQISEITKDKFISRSPSQTKVNKR